ncbi:MAG: hypothetical protein WCO84_08500, partial [bacterium]
DVLFVEKGRADKSRDLTTAKQAGAVVCKEVIRCQEQRPAASVATNPYLVVNAPNNHTHQAQPPAPRSAPQQVIPGFDQDQLARVIAEKVAQALNRPVTVINTPVEVPKLPSRFVPEAEVEAPAVETQPEIELEPLDLEGNGEDTPKKKRGRTKEN